MSRLSNRVLFRLATAAALFAALGLGACGRKGPLDPPPGARLAPAAADGTPAEPQERSLFGDPNMRDPGTAPVAPKGAKKHLPLDVLIE